MNSVLQTAEQKKSKSMAVKKVSSGPPVKDINEVSSKEKEVITSNDFIENDEKTEKGAH